MTEAILFILIKDGSKTDDEHRFHFTKCARSSSFAIDSDQNLIQVLDVKITILKEDARIDEQRYRLPEMGDFVICTTVLVLHFHQGAALIIDLHAIKWEVEIVLERVEGSDNNCPVTHDTTFNLYSILIGEAFGNIVVMLPETLLELGSKFNDI